MSKPKKTDRRRVTNPRSKMIGVLLTPQEWDAIDDYAAALGLTNSSWAREVLLDAIKEKPLADK